MSLDGLRAWIGEVERKLGVRTRVFLALAALAIGASGAAIYLALDAREGRFDEEDVELIEQRVQSQVGAAAAGAESPDVSRLEADLEALRSEVERLRDEDGGTAKDGGTGEDEGTSGEGASERSGEDEAAAEGAARPGTAAELKELAEKTREANE